jgi:hypothetical protein
VCQSTGPLLQSTLRFVAACPTQALLTAYHDITVGSKHQLFCPRFLYYLQWPLVLRDLSVIVRNNTACILELTRCWDLDITSALCVPYARLCWPCAWGGCGSGSQILSPQLRLVTCTQMRDVSSRRIFESESSTSRKTRLQCMFCSTSAPDHAWNALHSTPSASVRKVAREGFSEDLTSLVQAFKHSCACQQLGRAFYIGATAKLFSAGSRGKAPQLWRVLWQDIQASCLAR